MAIRHPSLCPLIMAGDPDIQATRDLLAACVKLGVGVVELCIPFKNAFTDGATLRRAHERALATGIAFDDVIALIRDFADKISVVILADSSHTLRPLGFSNACRSARDAGAAGLLAHGLPPRLSGEFQTAAAGVIPLVGTIYASSSPETRAEVLARSSAFLYLVSAYGRSGGTQIPDLGEHIDLLRSQTPLPIAIGFGLKTPGDVASAFRMGCDLAIVGSAISERIEYGLSHGDPVGCAVELISSLNAEAKNGLS